MVNDGTLSQEEIDALLNISEDEDSFKDVKEHLTSMEEDTLGEIGNISFGTSATTLSTLLNQKVEITTPTVTIIKEPEIYESFGYEHVSVRVNYIEGLTGQNLLVIKSVDAAIISDIMLGGDGTNPDKELTDIHLSAVQEAMNQMMGSAATSMSTIFGKRVNITPPEIEFNEPREQRSIVEIIDAKVFVKVSFQLKVGELIDSNIMQLIPYPFASELVEELLGGPPEESAQTEAVAEHVEEPRQHTESNAVTGQEDKIRTERQRIGEAVDQTSAVQPAVFTNFEQTQLNQNEQRNLDMLLDISLKVTVELGRTNRTIKDILDLSSGSIIELDKLAGEPVDILVNEKLIAKGEVVVIDENFGVRVTDIISQSDRLLQLK